ncbi:hypothetical protein B0H11DRAFT_69759 [Mycena galericulata]|nr:hypothetical protein B0H11DRAFT_69759 [Mycena galericulata]
MVLDYVNLISNPITRRVALTSCALVGRRFSRRSQMHLFSVVDLLEHVWEPTPHRLLILFSSLLRTTTHIAPYVKKLFIQSNENSREAACHILRSLPKLEVLDSRPNFKDRDGPPPTLFKALATIVTLPTLRCLGLKCMVFPDPHISTRSWSRALACHISKLSALRSSATDPRKVIPRLLCPASSSTRSH